VTNVAKTIFWTLVIALIVLTVFLLWYERK
jgi:hypothetical protein